MTSLYIRANASGSKLEQGLPHRGAWSAPLGRLQGLRLVALVLLPACFGMPGQGKPRQPLAGSPESEAPRGGASSTTTPWAQAGGPRAAGSGPAGSRRTRGAAGAGSPSDLELEGGAGAAAPPTPEAGAPSMQESGAPSMQQSPTVPTAGTQGGHAPGDDAIKAELDGLFPQAEQEPLRVYFSCQRRGLSFSYDYEFLGDGQLQVRLVTDTHVEMTLPGSYEYNEGVIRIDPIEGFTHFAERSGELVTGMGMVLGFATYVNEPGFSPDQPEMQCAAVGHGYNDPEQEVYRHYGRCTSQRFGDLTYDNALEFTTRVSVHGDLFVPGSIFRQREWYAGEGITRGYGVYRRVGDTYYAYFARQFDDVEFLKGEFVQQDGQVRDVQLGIECEL